MIGETVSHYKILEKLGEGGMGVVYKALDTTLDRHVAIKFLPPQLKSDKDAKKRFVHEAKAASALNHSNIAVIHEIDETPEGQMFIVMAFYDGHTLKDKLEDGPLPLDRTIDIVSQIASGLAVAHEKDILHRDIKPANILITERGEAKLADFGLAKLAGQTKVTTTGTTVGTVAYMSPEQASGREVDARADVFSLGVVLYELLTGEVPFRGDHEAAVLYGIMHTDPEPIATYRTDIPEDLLRIVDKALQKDVNRRYQNAGYILTDMERLRAGKGVSAPPSAGRSTWVRYWVVTALTALALILGYFGFSYYRSSRSDDSAPDRMMLAVLPFENLGPPEQEYFADGITGEITVRLTGFEELGIISRASVMGYKDTDKNIAQIGDELSVEYIMTGTVRWEGTGDHSARVRVTTELVSVADATQLWADAYDGSLSEIFDVQSDIAEKAASALNVTLLGPQQELLENKPTDSMEAYDYYLRGNDYFNLYGKQLRLAAQLFEDAVEADSNFAQAHAQLSRVYTEIYWHVNRSDEILAKAKRAVEKALTLAPTLPEGQIAMGSYYYHDGEYDRALEQFSMALKSQPNNGDIFADIGFVRSRQGLYDLAIDNLKRAVELDPRSEEKASVLASRFRRIKDFTQAESYIDRAISLAPDEESNYSTKAFIYINRDGDVEAARHIMRDALKTVDQTPGFRHQWAKIEACAGDYESALEKLAIDNPSSPGSHFYNMAAMYRLLEQAALARTYSDSARVVLEEKVAAAPDNSNYRVALGIAYAGLGRKEDAIREAELAVELAPVSEDYFYNVRLIPQLAYVYTVVGEYDSAIGQLEYLLSSIHGGETTVPSLRVDWRWIPLRDHPQFEELLVKYSTGQSY
jgi:non-specific serine/threonine protein kinase